MNREDCAALDTAPVTVRLAAIAARFAPGAEGVIYLDANSIGPMPATVPSRLAARLEEGWRLARRRSWNEARWDWLGEPRTHGAAIAHLLGAGPGDVLVADTTTVNHTKLLAHGLALRAPRRTIVVEQPVFPSNRYAAEGLARHGLAQLRSIAALPAQAGAAFDATFQSTFEAALEATLVPDDVAVVSLSLVDYRSGARLDMPRLTELAHRHGALVLWDLSHAAGASAIDVAAADADFAVGCGYKYLCGGPGAPAFLYVHPRHQGQAWPLLAGWMGHASPFDFEPAYVPAPGVARFAVGTPPVLAHAAFGGAAEIWRDVEVAALDARHRSLHETLIALVDAQLVPLGVELASPREAARRGGHIALRFNAPGADVSALGQALVAAGVVVSTRQPDALRLAPHPLVTRHVELADAVQRLAEVLRSERWREPRFAKPSV